MRFRRSNSPSIGWWPSQKLTRLRKSNSPSIGWWPSPKLMEIKFTFYWLMTKSKTDKNGNRESWKTWMKYCSSSRVHKTKRALYLRVSFLRNGGRVSLTKKNLQKMNFSAASLKKKKPMKIRQPKNKTLQKMSFSCVSLLLQQLRKKNRDIRRNNKSLFKL